MYVQTKKGQPLITSVSGEHHHDFFYTHSKLLSLRFSLEKRERKGQGNVRRMNFLLKNEFRWYRGKGENLEHAGRAHFKKFPKNRCIYLTVFANFFASSRFKSKPGYCSLEAMFLYAKHVFCENFRNFQVLNIEGGLL